MVGRMHKPSVRWIVNGVRITGALALVFSAAWFSACGDTPLNPGAGTQVAKGESPLVWSEDGSEVLFFSDSTRSCATRQARCDRILAVNAVTLQVREVAQGLFQGGGFPPAQSIAGMAYLTACGTTCAQVTLRTGGRDSVLATPANWLLASADGSRLIYGVGLSYDDGRPDSIGIIDLVHQTHERVAVPDNSRPFALSPTGSELLAGSNGFGPFWIISLANGGSRPVEDAAILNNESRCIGWNNDGVWFITDFGHKLSVLNSTTGATQSYTTGPSRYLEGGAVASGARGAVVWSYDCVDFKSDQCVQTQYYMWYWDPVRGVDTLLEHRDAAPTAFEELHDLVASVAISPNGHKVAFARAGEIRVLDF